MLGLRGVRCKRNDGKSGPLTQTGFISHRATGRLVARAQTGAP
jgi:hypothetical protein